MITVRGVQKYYGAHPAVRGVDFQIKAGECVGLLGLNGAGKSTTLMMLACLLRPTAGTITIHGVSANERPQEIRGLIGYLAETPPLYGDMTVRAYLTFAGGLRGMTAGHIELRVRAVAKSCDLARVLDVQISSLSHGFRQRIGIAQAILHEPALLILDEPTQGLDPVQIVEVRRLIRSLRGDHTILLSTHILSEIEAVCDRILVLHEGRLAAQGTEAELVMRHGATGGGMELEVRASESELREALATLETTLGVQIQVTVREVAGDVLRVHVGAAGELRAAVSRAVVEAGHDLLAMRRTQSGLEAMFQNLGAAADPLGAQDAGDEVPS